MDLALLVRAFEKERRDLRFESFAGAAAHLVLARHAAGRGRKGAAAGVLKLLSRRDHGLRADDAGTAAGVTCPGRNRSPPGGGLAERGQARRLSSPSAGSFL